MRHLNQSDRQSLLGGKNGKTLKSTPWKWITAVAVVTLLFMFILIASNNQLPWPTNVLSGDNMKIKNNIKVNSYLNDDRISMINDDSGLSDSAKFDLITYLPGLTVNINSLGYHMFSGYVDVEYNDDDDVDRDIQKQLFYWFFTADTDNADDQPLFLWTNGGPG